MTNHERLSAAVKKYFEYLQFHCGEDVSESHLYQVMKPVVDEAVRKERRCAAERALKMMHRLNTDYRYEIEECIRNGGAE